jgi:uncharacterized membrane protein
MQNKQSATHLSQRLVRRNIDFQLRPQAVQSLSSTLILILGLPIAMLLTVLHIYFLILILSG